MYIEAQQETRLSEYPEFASTSIVLQQEESYNDALLLRILEKHLAYMQSDAVPQEKRPSNEQVAQALQNEYQILHLLRFPHNIDVFCRFNLNRVDNNLTIDQAIEESSRIKEVVQNWAKGLSLSHRWFIFFVALLPGVACRVFQASYREMAEKYNFPIEDVAYLVKSHSAFLANSQYPQFSHPSYEQAIIELLRENFASSVGKVVDSALRQVLLLDTLSLGLCDNADYTWPRAEDGQPLMMKEYLEQFIEAYNHLIPPFFTLISDRLPPYCRRTAALLLLADLDRGSILISIVDSKDASTRIYLEYPNSVSERMQQLMQQGQKALVPVGFWSLQADDLRQRSPQIHAFSVLKDRVDYVFQKQRLEEAWPLLHARAERTLHYLSSSPLRFDVDCDKPFSSDRMPELWSEFTKRTQQRPEGWPEAGWNNLMHSSTHNLYGLEKSVKMLEELGHEYDGPLFTQPDLPIPNQVFSSWSRYSSNQMKAAVQRFFELALEAYRQMVESNFSSLKDRFTLYKHGTIKVLGGITYTSHFGSSLCRFYFLPADFPLLEDGNFEIYTKCDLESNVPYFLPFEQSVQERLKLAEAVSRLPSMGMGPSYFTSGKELIKLAYDWLHEGLDEAMSWRNIGQTRTHIQHQQASSINLPPNTSLYWDMYHFNDAWERFDWPSI